MEYKKELTKIIDRYAVSLHRQLESDVAQASEKLDGRFEDSKEELQKKLLEGVVQKLSAEVDQYDTQVLMKFVVIFSEMINSLKNRTLTDFSPLSVNGYIFTPVDQTPLAIAVEKEDCKTPLGRILIYLDHIAVMTSVREYNYHLDSEFIHDEVVMNILGNFIVKLNTRSYVAPL